MTTRTETTINVDENEITGKSKVWLVGAMFEFIATQLSRTQLAILAIIIAFIPIFGIVVIGQGLSTFNTGMASSTWPHVTGKMVRASVRTQGTVEQNSYRNRPTSPTYYPEVTYEYTVNGQTYQSTRFTAQDSGYSTSLEAFNAIDQVNGKDGLTVYYNPGNPKDAMLKPGVSGNSYGSLFVGILLLIFGGAPVVWLVWRIWHKSEPANQQPNPV